MINRNKEGKANTTFLDNGKPHLFFSTTQEFFSIYIKIIDSNLIRASTKLSQKKIKTEAYHEYI